MRDNQRVRESKAIEFLATEGGNQRRGRLLEEPSEKEPEIYRL